MKNSRTMYKIFETDDEGKVKTLFHGIEGSRVVPRGEVWVADEKMVRDGSTGPEYLSGFHVLPTKEDCEKYLTRFSTRLDKLVIMPVKVRKLRPKAHSNSPVMLASEMLMEA